VHLYLYLLPTLRVFYYPCRYLYLYLLPKVIGSSLLDPPSRDFPTTNPIQNSGFFLRYSKLAYQFVHMKSSNATQKCITIDNDVVQYEQFEWSDKKQQQ
jgi:hypothetical protein